MSLPAAADLRPAPSRPAARPSAAIAATALGLLLGLQPLTTDLYLPAFPALTRDLAAPMHLAQLTMSALLLAFGAAQLVWGPLADRWGRKDPDVVRPDPEAPAFTWPEPPGAPWGGVLVCVDRDMSPIRVKARKAAGGGSFDLSVDGEARARICAGLALAAWRRAGSAHVRAIAPGAGRDFNDELVARRVESAAGAPAVRPTNNERAA